MLHFNSYFLFKQKEKLSLNNAAEKLCSKSIIETLDLNSKSQFQINSNNNNNNKLDV